MTIKDRTAWQPEINEVKHRIELIAYRDGWDGLMTGDALDGALAAIFNGIAAETYTEAARIAGLKQGDYPRHPAIRAALRRLASYFRTL